MTKTKQMCQHPERFDMDRVPTLYMVHPNNAAPPVKYDKEVGFDGDLKEVTGWLEQQLRASVKPGASTKTEL